MNDSVPAKKHTLGMLLAATSLLCGSHYDYGDGDRVIETKKDLRPCLNCGKLHDHNNGFCCPECCKAWRNKNREAI